MVRLIISLQVHSTDVITTEQDMTPQLQQLQYEPVMSGLRAKLQGN